MLPSPAATVVCPPDCLLGPAVRALLPATWSAAVPAPGWDRDPALAPAWEACRLATREHARSFHFASVALARPTRRAAFALYAFCRHVDDAIDHADPATAPTREQLLAELDALLAGTSSLPFGPALATVADTFAIPRAFFADLIEGCARDREPARMANFAELEVYCYYVASVVGLMMAKIFGLQDPAGVPRAVEMGVALQLTNILRDVREDLERGRLYLPADELAAAGLTPADLAQGRTDGPWPTFMRAQIARTRQYYAAGALGLPLLAAGGPRRTASLMARLYAGILDAIEAQQYDIFARRAHVTFAGKVRLALWG